MWFGFVEVIKTTACRSTDCISEGWASISTWLVLVMGSECGTTLDEALQAQAQGGIS